MKLCALHYFALKCWQREKFGAELNKARKSSSSGCGLDRWGAEGRARDLSWGWAPARYNRRNMSQSVIRSVGCLTTGPQPRVEPLLHTVRSSAFSSNLQYPHFSLRSSSSCLPLLPRLPITSTLPSIFPSIPCFRRQFLRDMWPIQLAFLLFIVCSIFLSSLSLCNTSSFLTRSVQLIFSILLQHHHISQLSRYSWSSVRSVQACHRVACSKIREDWCPDCTTDGTLSVQYNGMRQ